MEWDRRIFHRNDGVREDDSVMSANFPITEITSASTKIDIAVDEDDEEA